ncbi:hypothetical protein F5883DRAFT_647273 [Diaporthe sp. PMI_573]|nr:hypothetical protein F5883DRAFT_647273 [Diaporthaceae sp. PMI_573]
MRLHTNLVLLGLGLVGSALATSYCCIPNCRICLQKSKCGLGWGDCTDSIFSTCCADDKKLKTFMPEEDYLAAIA